MIILLSTFLIYFLHYYTLFGMSLFSDEIILTYYTVALVLPISIVVSGVV